jgi:hypothetical protein
MPCNPATLQPWKRFARNGARKGLHLALLLIVSYPPSLDAALGPAEIAATLEVDPQAARTWVFAAAIGSGTWGTTPPTAHINWTDSPVDLSGPIYLTGHAKSDQGGGFVSYGNSPILLRDADFIEGSSSRLIAFLLPEARHRAFAWA